MKYNDNGEVKELNLKVMDTLPVGSVVDYDGDVIPDGWEPLPDEPKHVYNGDDNIIGFYFGKPLYSHVIRLWKRVEANEWTGLVDISSFNPQRIIRCDLYDESGNLWVGYKSCMGGALSCYLMHAATITEIILEYTKTTD